MKATGIVRRIDELGRIVIPMELRRTLHISERDALEIFTDEDTIVLKKFSASCALCGQEGNLIQYMDKHICSACKTEIKNMQ